ncbi:MAG: hypothetical protein FWC23_07150 [Chitinispirillia bacterium]|nr:hypothetical protein [Chitinispirillia bacterium]MCL2268945.1 hypothetical protein [Chitinispirillia bacterium]
MNPAPALTKFLESHRFTHQTRRELAEWLPEIAYRENISIDDILNGDKIRTIIENEKLNAPQKSQKIRNELYKMRFPEYSKLQDRWKKTAAAANPSPSKIQFIPSPGFEKKRLEIKLTIESAADAKDILASLSQIAPHIWDELIFPH